MTRAGWGSLAGAVVVVAASLVAPLSPATASEASSDVLIDVDGTLLVMYSESPTGAGAAEPDRSVSVLVGDSYIELDGSQVDDAATGDRFQGTVAVPEEIADAAAGTAAASDAEVLAAAAEAEEPVAITDGDIVTALASTATPHSHSFQIALPTVGGTASPYNASSGQSMMNLVSGYWQGQSDGAIDSSSVGVPVSYTSGLACTADPRPMWAEAINRTYPTYANSLQGLSAFLAQDDGRHVAVILPAACGASSPIGVGVVGNSLHSNGVLTIVGGTGIDKSTVIHEVGHNMGLGHSNLVVCAATCSSSEYGDFWDVMGKGIVGYDSPGQLNIRSKWALGFVDATQVPLVEIGSAATLSTVRTLAQINSYGTVGYRIKDPVTGEILFVENRAGETGTFYSAPNKTAGIGGLTIPMRTGIRLSGATAQGGSQVFARTCPDRSDWTCATASAVGQQVSNASGSVTVTMLATGGSAANNIRIDLVAGAPVYRFYSPQNATHFYTISTAERDAIVASYPPQVWTYEGVAYTAYATPVAGSTPLYRFYSPSMKGHFFTISDTEKSSIIANFPSTTWTFEGTAYYVLPVSANPATSTLVYRFWSPKNQHHFYTASPTEKNQIQAGYPAEIWTYEGESFRVPTT